MSCKLAEFLVPSTAKYCLAFYVSRMLLPRLSRKQLGRRGTTMSQALAALHIGILAISNLPEPVCLPERNFAVFFRSPFSLRRPLRPSVNPSARASTFVVHKVYSPRDRRSFFCDSTSDSREVIPPAEPRSREAFSSCFSEHRWYGVPNRFLSFLKNIYFVNLLSL